MRFSLKSPTDLRARSLTLLAVLGALSASCAIDPSTDESVDVNDEGITIDPNATYTIVGVGSSKCVGVTGSSTASSATLEIDTCSGTTSQQFRAESMGSGFFRLRNGKSGLCVSVSGASTANGAAIVQLACGTGSSQQWSFTDVATGVERITVRSSGEVLDVVGKSTANGAKLDQWPSNNQTNQQFKLVSVGGSSSSSSVSSTAATSSSGTGSSSSSSSSSSGGGTPEPACNFASGLNVAWVNFANDVPNPNIGMFNTIFQNTFNAGGRIVRWWFHTNGTVTPGYDASGKAKPLQQSHIDGLKAILKAASNAGIGLNISLWSFDMLQSNAGSAHTNNQLLLENDANRQAYIDNYLTPLVTALKGTPGLYSYEIFNEPEGMGPNGWATFRTTEAFIQKSVNWFAAAIHAADPDVLVTNGAVTFDYCSYAAGKNNFYSDTALRNAGGKQNGILDFYEVHYYTSNGASNSPYTHTAATWGLARDNKKLVIGEFAAQDTDGVAKNNLFTSLYSGGYNGAWAWAYTADWPWPAMQTPMQNLFSAHPDVGSCQ